MDILKVQAANRKLRYATEAYENHECTGDGCERCKNAENSANEAIADIPKWIVILGTIIGTIYYYATWPFTKLWCKLFHNHNDHTPGKGSKKQCQTFTHVP